MATRVERRFGGVVVEVGPSGGCGTIGAMNDDFEVVAGGGEGPSGGESGPDAGGAPPPEPPPWLGQFQQDFANKLAEMGAEFEGRLRPADGHGGGDREYGDDGFTEGDGAFGAPVMGEDGSPVDDEFELDPRGAALLDQLAEPEDIRETIDQHLAERLKPLVEARREEGFERLGDRYPELRFEPLEGATQRERDQLDERRAAFVNEVRAQAELAGSPDATRNPNFVELVHLAGMARAELAARELRAADERRRAEAAREFQLEGDGGTPGQPEPDHLFQEIWARQQNKHLSWD
jgi:hypothetical protein